MVTQKTTKKRPKKSKKSKFGRFSAIISILLLCVLLGYLSFLSVKHFSKKDEPKSVSVVNVRKIDKNITKIEKDEPKKNVYKMAVKFSKDENLSKIFLDPKSNDETPFLNQPVQEPKKLNNTEIKNMEPNKEQKHKITEPKIDIKPEQKPSNLPLITIKKPIKIEQNSTNLELKIEQNQTKQKPSDKNQTTVKTEQKPPKKQEPKKEPQTIKHKLSKPNAKPKLAIIIDDVANKSHVDMIRSTGLKKLIPSFFPKSSTHKDTPVLAKSFDFYMIHLPMQANIFKNEEIDTLRVGESIESIDKKVARIRSDFANAKFINNHTGSRFTSDFSSVDKAYMAFIKYGFTFVDSRTIAATKVKEVAKKYAKPYIMRDVFLDDRNDKASIKKSIDEAIACAKRNGYAIAIGHPRKNTIEILKQNKDYILNNVELVYINEIYEYYR